MGNGVVGTDYAQNKVFDRSFAPYGEMYNNTTFNSYNSETASFTGNTQDLDLNLFDTDAREESFIQGRWINPDPSGLAASSLKDPQSLNRYSYVRNSAMGMTDPSGLGAVGVNWFSFGSGPEGMAGGGGGDSGGSTTAINDFNVPGWFGGYTRSIGQQPGSLGYYLGQVQAGFINLQNPDYIKDAVETQQENLAEKMSLASKSPDGSNWDTIYANLNPYKQDGITFNISGGNVDFTWRDPANPPDFVPQSRLETGGCEILCRYGFMDQIHYNHSMFHLDTAGVNWGFGLGAIIHGIADLGLGNLDPNTPLVWW
jgi:RHS repeat-associated protein